MSGVWARVFAVYPLAIPLVLGLLAAIFPGYIVYDDVSRRVSLSFSVEEIGAAIIGGYAIISGIYAKWGIKK